MKLRTSTLLGLSALAANAAAAERPNIVIILADDMGYSDLGCYGGEIETPNIDRLASQGLRFRQFYNCARSCPTRASLLTGLYPHQAGMGWMAAADLQRPAYQGYLNNQCVTIAEVLQAAGYGTYMSGKWHVSSDRQNKGGVKDNWPLQRGFGRYFGIVEGASNYWNVHYTNDNEQGQSPDDGSFYLTNALSDSAAAFIGRHDYRQRPLFLYLAFNAPHWPLHALQSDIDKYVERYKAGWDELRRQRFERQKQTGLFGDKAILSPRDETIQAWDSLSHEQQDEFARRMAIYAAQIDAMDRGVGNVIKALTDRGQIDNTLIFFLSDNGACAEHISSGERKTLDGKADTYESYRINWANLSSTPYREYKHYTYEGGIATPLIVHYPDGISSKLNGQWVDEYGHLIDLMATCVDIGKAPYPASFNGHVITPAQGESLKPVFKGEALNRLKPLFWEHEGNIAMRDGQWKILTKTNENEPYDEKSVKLYNLKDDPTEMNDLSQQYPDRKARMYAAWSKWAESIDVFPIDTRGYGARQIAYKRVVNGEFDDNFGDWNTVCRPAAKADFVIDEKNTISGNKTARIDVHKTGEQPASVQLQWQMRLKKNERLNVSYMAKSAAKGSLLFRIEKANDASQRLADIEARLTAKPQQFDAKTVTIPEEGAYRIVFCLGKATGTYWIDNVKINISDE